MKAAHENCASAEGDAALTVDGDQWPSGPEQRRAAQAEARSATRHSFHGTTGATLPPLLSPARRFALLESHRPRLAHWVKKWLGARADAWIGVDDILQEVFWSAARTQANLRSDEPSVVRSWLFRIARNRVRDHARRRERRGLEMEDRGSALDELADRDSTCAELVSEVHAVTRAAIGSMVHLEGGERMALVLRDLLEAPWETTAFLLDRPSYRAARSALARARSSLDRAPLEKA